MRIAFFTDTYYPDLNGVVISVDNFTKALREKGHEVYVFAPKIKGKYKDKDKYLTRLPSIKILANVEPEIYSPTPWPNKAFRKMFTEDFDIIHAHGNGPYSFLGYSMAKLKGIPFVMTFHTIHTLYTHYIFNGKLITPGMVAMALKTFANRCDGILTPSEKMKKELRKYGVKKNISIIPNFLNTAMYRKYEEGYLQKLLNLPKETPLVLTVARIGKEKNIDFLLKVFKIVFEQDRKTHFVIVGRGPEKDNLQALAKKLKIDKRVHFTGLIEYEHMPSVYRSCLLFAFASYTETQGVCILEAAEAQVPSVVSDDAAFANMVVNGENGFLLPLDEKKFAEKILLLLNDKKLREKLAKKSKEIAEKNFSKQRITKDLLDIYENLINKKTKLRLMRKVSVVVRTEEPIEELWDLMIDVNKWDKLIKFVRKISIKEPVKEGAQFYDTTGIMWFPTHIKHRITKIEKYKKFSMEAYLPLKNGKMFQTIEMKKTGEWADISIEIKFYIRFSLFDLISGPILERRLKHMLVETVKRVESEARRRKIGKGKGIAELITN